MTKVLFGAAALAALIAIAPATAQSGQVAPAPHGQHGAAKPAHSRAQLGAHVTAMFQRLDANRDGIITKAESAAAKGQRGGRKGGQAERRGDRSPERRTDNRAAMFDRLDANRDGSISRAEFAAAPARRERRLAGRTDRNGERGMERGRTMRGGGKGMGRMGRMGFGGHMFDMADANRDGQITREERMQMHQRMRGAKTEG